MLLIALFIMSGVVFASPINSKAYHKELLAVTINRRDTNHIIYILYDNAGAAWVPSRILGNYKIPPNTLQTNYHGESYVSLRDLHVEYSIDQHQSRIFLALPATNFKHSGFNLEQSKLVKPQPSPLGGFLNYDFFAQKMYQTKTITNAVFNMGIFNHFGIVTNDLLEKDIGAKTQSIRLNTTWRIDRPNTMQTLRFGDTYSVPGLWGRSVAFAGVQWGRNFGTQPGFITFPLPSANGIASMPSTADVYLNNALIGKRDVNTGPFEINNIPVITGAGNVQLVVTDVMGRQQLVSVPYYASQEILRPGLHDFSFSAGFVRHNFGIKSNDYREFVATGTDTIGITNGLTAQYHGEFSAKEQAIGMGTNMLINNYGILTTAIAASHSDRDICGGLALLRFRRQSKRFSYGFGIEATTENFRQLGYSKDNPPPKLQTEAFMGFPISHSSSFNISYIGRDNRNSAAEHFISANYNLTLLHNIYLSLSGITNIGGVSNKAIFLSLTMNLGTRTTASFNAAGKQNDSYAAMQIQRNLPAGTGFGYKVRAQGGRNKNALGGLFYQNKYGRYSAQVAYDHGTNYQVEATGGIAALQNNLYLSRRIDDSFAVVDVDDYANIPVYLENHKIGVTNRQGKLLVPDLNAYIINHISINPNELPLSASIPKSKFDVVPYYRSGILLKLPIRDSRGVLLTLKQQNGKNVPAGAIIKVQGRNQTSYVGYSGKAYLVNLSKTNHLLVQWENSSCHATIKYHPGKDIIPNLGVIICKNQAFKTKAVEPEGGLK